MEVTTKNSLTPARRQLLHMAQHMGHGRIENLLVRNGQPVLDPLPRVIREVKLGGAPVPPVAICGQDFALKAQWRDLLGLFDRVQDGTLICVEVKHGLPFRATLSETPT